MTILNKGYVQIYTGDGKGKTTAALGLAVRALSRGLKVCFIQFLKGNESTGECALLKEQFKNATAISTGTKKFVFGSPSEDDFNEAKRGVDEAKKAVSSNNYDLVILDEVNGAIDLGIIALDEIVKMIKNKPDNIELVLTGRGANSELIKLADLVTEMMPIKHYYDAGVKERIGIEK